ncbi:probable WRKY transcription factor 29 [Cucurbita maxima]|uniref:Probable WRKY transcription factor 29 n=1 Tax=Cucurbita maxima TaxID=3661 RepID=A0A6J1JDJ7_CUCMA|nr:probable WRKY transcription factor 29 [Cucurbita maxima]
MEDWDLQAIVKGCNGSITSSRTATLMEDPNLVSFLIEKDELLSSCSVYDEFEGLFGSSDDSASASASAAAISGLLRELKEPEKLHRKSQIAATKQKQSKKSRQNRVVKEVKAEGVCSDSWGWRKYGQKPIKGSPYPRSYYRCSSSKGCSARKQVERSLSDPGAFVITYTAEHNHAEPTRRNALAGTTRKKFPAPENPRLDMSVASVEEEQPMEGVIMDLPFEFFSGLEDFLFE